MAERRTPRGRLLRWSLGLPRNGQSPTQWTIAHEIGHVLDLIHVNNNDLLMTGNGTANITDPPPDLVASEGASY